MTQDEKTKIEEENCRRIEDSLRPRNTSKHIRPWYDLQDRPARRWHIRYGYDLYFAILSGSRLYFRRR